MFLGQIHSPANPFQGSAFSAYGYKPASGVIAFSIGDPGDYSTNMPNGSAPTVSVTGGVATFSCPQTDPYMGIGDLVLTGLWSVYIVGKISNRQWIVRNPNGDIPSDKSEIMLIRVDKAYNHLYGVFDPVGGAGYKIGSYDLVDKELSLYVPCYEKATYTSDTISISGWTCSAGHHIKVYTPTDIERECNSSQRHSHLYGGFFVESNAVSTLIECDSDYIHIDGLSLKETGACNIGIEVQGAGIVSNCIIDGFATDAIKVNEASEDVEVINNLVYSGSDVGIAVNATTKLINNTAYGYPTGYEFTSPGANTYVVNCIAANNAANGFDASSPPTLYNCASDDATVGSSNGCIPNAAIKFYDTSANDYRLTNANRDISGKNVVQDGLDLRTTSPYFVTHDCANNPNDNTISMGALHLVPCVPSAIGDTTSDIKTGAPNMSISDGVITFDTAQTNDLLSAGCIITPGSIKLLEKIDSTNWRGVISDGFAPSDDAGPTAITSINFDFDSLHAASPPDSDMVGYDVSWKVLLVEKTITSDTATTKSGITCDETRSISIYAPVSGSECNSNRRHSGVWDDDLMYIKGLITSELGYVFIGGLQLGTDGSIDAIDARNEFTSVKQCIVKESDNGIKVRPKLNTASKMLIANNVVYDCDSEGIKLENTSAGTESRFGVYNNTTYGCRNGISFDGLNGSNTNIVRLVNNLSATNSGKDIVGDGSRTELVTSESNWTSDISAYSLDFDRNNDIFKTFRFNDLNGRDFHIPLYQHLSMITGYVAASDYMFQIFNDIDSSTRPTDKYWSIGADQYSIPSKSIAYFSIGISTADLQNDPGVSVSVEGSIATFGEALNSDIGIGDKVTLTTNGPLYLAEKGSSIVWRVVDNQGNSVSDFTGDTLVDIKRVTNSLNDAVSSDVESELNFAVNPKDLVSNTTEVNVECYQDTTAADSAQVSVSGWTADSDYPFRVHVPFDLYTQCGRRQRHIGVWSDSYYHLDVNGDAIAVSDEHIYFDGLQVDPTNNKGFDFSTADGCRVERCIIRDCSYGIDQDTTFYSIVAIANTIYNSSQYGIRLQFGNAYNNTVVSDNGILLYSGTVGILKNCIAQGSGTNYVGMPSTRESCISEDATATGTNCKTNVVLDFFGTLNYHLARNDFEAINYGVDGDYAPSLDIDSSPVMTPSIGSHCPNFSTVDVYFSCGKVTGSFASSSLKVTIEGNTATFTKDIDNELLMVGDKLVYDVDNKVAYFKQKISSDQWIMINDLGQNATAVSGKDVVSISRSFNSLINLFDTSHADSIAQFYGTSSNPFTSLEKGKVNIHISVGGEAPYNDPVVATGYNCDSSNHFTLFAPYDTDTQCNARHKHNGYYDADPTRYYSALIWSSSSLETQMLSLSCSYTEVNGLVIAGLNASGGKDCIATSVVGCKIVNNILHTARNGVNSTPAMLRTVIANNIIYDCYISGIATSLLDYVLNNTISDITQNGMIDTVGSHIVNNIVQYTGLACFSNGTSPEYCVTDDGSATGTGCLNQSLAFSDRPNNKYSLAKSDPRGRGIQFASYPTWSFSTDAIEVERGNFWDMGALEYQATKKLYMSVGDSVGHQTNPSDGILKMTVDGDSIATFTAPQTSSKIVSGDKIVTPSQSFHLGEKITTSKWYITNFDGTPVVSGIYTVTSINRYISNLSSLSYAIYSNTGSSNLANSETQVNVTIPDGDNIGGYGTSLAFTCDVDYFIRIFAPIDTTKYCNSSQRHKGRYVSGEGAVLNITENEYAIKATLTNYIEISGLVISNEGGTDSAINLEDCIGFVINSNIIRKCQGGGIRARADSGVSQGYRCVVVNNTLFECLVHGVRIEGYSANTAWVMNNTIIDCGNCLHFVKQSTGNLMLNSYNNIFQGSAFGDMVEDHVENTGKLISQYNISEDSSVGSSEHNFNNTVLEFIDKSIEDFDLDPEADSIAIDTGIDLQIISPYHFETDIRGIERETLFWDRGALERNENIGSGSMALGPLYMSVSVGVVTDEAPTTILYLRETKDAPVDEAFQFTHIEMLNPLDTDAVNSYLAWNDIDNIIIYVEGGWTPDPGTFALNDRGNRTVTIMTDPSEIADNGPASIVYGEFSDSDGLVDDASAQGSLTFKNLLIYSQDDQNADYLITSAANTDKMIFINCIVQLNKDTITDAACIVELINSYLLFFNESDSAVLYLVKNAITGHANFNSLLICESSDAKEFKTCTGPLNDYINNAMSYNHGSGSFAITAPGRKLLCLENTDPSITELESNWATSDVSTIMQQSNFKPLLESQLINNGNDTSAKWLSYDIETDIIGNDRIFEFEHVDIGTYEVEIHIMDIAGTDIRSIDQVKIEIDRVNKRCVSLNGDSVYQGLFDVFQYDQDSLEEFIREEKIAIELKNTEKQFAKKSDKVNPLIAEFDAYYDAPTRTILVKKIGGDLSWILGQMLEDDSYILNFNEQDHKLSLYLNEVTTLGVCGSRNPIKNVRFGGNPVFNG